MRPRTLLLVASAAALLGAPAHARRVEGTIAYHWPGRPGPTFYRYEIVFDSTGSSVTLREGNGPDAPAVMLPPFILRNLADRVDLADPAGRRRGRMEVGVERGAVLLAVERRLSLALLGLGVALTAAVGLALVARRVRRRYAILAEARRSELAGREAERLRIAREIHDGPVQLLHLVRMNLAAPPPVVREPRAEGGPAGPEPPADAAGGEGARHDIAEAVRELRSIAEGLRPPALGPFGLAPALEDLAVRFREQHPAIALDVHVEDDGGRIGEDARLALFRVAQEALSNAAAHGAPARVGLRLAVSERGVELTVEDDGRGAELPPDPTVLGRAGHFGLLGMRERAELLGARLDVRSAPGHGTTVCLRAPWGALTAPARPAGRPRWPFTRTSTPGAAR